MQQSPQTRHEQTHTFGAVAYRYGAKIPDMSYIEGPASHVLTRPNKFLHRGEHLFRNGDEVDAIYIVTSGCFKTRVIDIEGREHIHGFHLAGEYLGLDALYDERHHTDAVALDTAGLKKLDIALLFDGSYGSHMTRELQMMMSREINILNALASDHTAEQRFTAFLRGYSERMREQHQSHREFHLPMSRADIGNYLRLTPCTVSRLLTHLKKMNIISVDGSLIRILEPRRLSELCSDVALA